MADVDADGDGSLHIWRFFFFFFFFFLREKVTGARNSEAFWPGLAENVQHIFPGQLEPTQRLRRTNRTNLSLNATPCARGPCTRLLHIAGIRLLRKTTPALPHPTSPHTWLAQRPWVAFVPRQRNIQQARRKTLPPPSTPVPGPYVHQAQRLTEVATPSPTRPAADKDTGPAPQLSADKCMLLAITACLTKQLVVLLLFLTVTGPHELAAPRRPCGPDSCFSPGHGYHCNPKRELQDPIGTCPRLTQAVVPRLSVHMTPTPCACLKSVGCDTPRSLAAAHTRHCTTLIQRAETSIPAAPPCK